MNDLSSLFIEPGGDEKYYPAPEISRFPVWSGWDVVFLGLFSAFGGFILAAVGEAVRHLAQSQLKSLRFLLHPSHEGVYLILFQSAFDCMILLFIFSTIRLKYNAPFWKSIKWQSKTHTPLAGLLVMGILLAIAVVVASSLFPSSNEPPLEKILKVRLAAILFAGLGVFIAPFVEELAFRGFLYPVLERRWGRAFAVISTALLFSGVHLSQLWGSWPAILLITAVGFTLSLVRARTDALLPSFVVHLTYNSTICAMFLIGFLFQADPKN
jgi:membrane protease YdiL (CAAX protease family)